MDPCSDGHTDSCIGIVEVLAWRRAHAAKGISAQSGFAPEKCSLQSWSELCFIIHIRRKKKSKLMIVTKALQDKAQIVNHAIWVTDMCPVQLNWTIFSLWT